MSRKSFKLLTLIISIFFCINCIRAVEYTYYATEADAAKGMTGDIKYCYYSDTGSAVNDSKYSVVIAIDGDKNAKASVRSMYDIQAYVGTPAKSQTLSNWKDSDSEFDKDRNGKIFNAYNSYSNKCFDFVYIHQYNSGGATKAKIYWLDSFDGVDALNKDFGVDGYYDYTFSLIKEEKLAATKMECVYTFEYETKGTSVQSNAYDVLFGDKTVSETFTLKYDENGFINNSQEFVDDAKMHKFLFSPEFVSVSGKSIKDVCPKTTVVYRFNALQNRDMLILHYGDPGEEDYIDTTCSGGSCNPESADSDICPTFDNIFKEKLEDLYQSTDLAKYKAKKEQLISWCHSVLSYGKFDLPCVKVCLDIDERIKEIEKNSINQRRTCGFSNKLIIWVANIVRWIKYIIPALIVLLSALDFTKSLLAEKEDEMAKAKKHFVIRIVVAVLIFIAPFIIEFILGLFGLDANGCGVIDF